MKNLEERKIFGIVRPVHKARLAAEKVAAALNVKHPEPMSFMHRREKDGSIPEKAFPKAFPNNPTLTLGKIDKVARAVADWDKSDPFAYGRAVLHVKQGYIRADETIKEMEQRTLARKVAKAREVDYAKTITS